MTHPDPLPAPYDAPPDPDGLIPRAETLALVTSQIDALLTRTPSFHALPDRDRVELKSQLVRIGAYAAELVRDAWAQSRRIGQTPLVIERTTWRPDPAGPPGRGPARTQADLQTSATGRVADITRTTLKAIAFPTFVADLINGTFDAIIGATIKQMQAFMELVSQVSKTLDEFQRDHITDNQARDWLVQSSPGLLRISTEGGEPQVVPTEAGDGADAAALAGMQGALGLPDPVRALDEETINATLVPAARRKLAEGRLQMLSSLVMLGLQRIVIRHGRIRATMGFHIDAADRAHAEEASAFDASLQASVSGFYYVAFSAQTSVAYVSSQKADSDSAINVQADLTGEVDLTFETDYLPLNRLARAESIEKIRANTPNPAANTPNHSATAVARSDAGPSSGQVVQDAVKAHTAKPAPTISDQLIKAAAGAAGGGGAGNAAGALVGAAGGK